MSVWCSANTHPCHVRNFRNSVNFTVTMIFKITLFNQKCVVVFFSQHICYLPYHTGLGLLLAILNCLRGNPWEHTIYENTRALAHTCTHTHTHAHTHTHMHAHMHILGEVRAREAT